MSAVGNLGPKWTGLVAANTAKQLGQDAWAALGAAREARSAVWEDPGPLEAFEKEGEGGIFRFTRAELEIAFISPAVVRVTWTPGVLPVPYGLDPAGVAGTGITRVAEPENGAGWYVIGSADAAVRVSDLGAIELAMPGTGIGRRAGGRGKAAPGGPGASSDEEGWAKQVEWANVTVLRRDEPPTRSGEAWQLRYHLAGSMMTSGLGEKAGGLDLSGRRYRLWNRDPGGIWGPGADPLYVGIPVTVSVDTNDPSRCVGCFYENPFESVFELGGEKQAGPATSSVRFKGGALRYYLMAGALGEVVGAYMSLTGKPPLPPRWALGYHQSQWGYKSGDDVRRICAGFAEMKLPLSAIHLDIDYMDGYRVFTIDQAKFPDFRSLSDEIGASGTRIVTILDPAVKADGANEMYREGTERGYYVASEGGRAYEGIVWPGRAAFPDFTDPAARRWWASKYQILTGAGVAGVWHDMNEPTDISLAGDKTLPRSLPHSMDGRGGVHAEAHNFYGLEMNAAGFEGLREAEPERRPFVLSRSGWAGVQRYAWTWSGDSAATWGAYRQQIATAIGLGLSGVAFSGSDIGGFNGAPGEELYVRWLQLGMLMPLARTHCVQGVPEREPWRWPGEVRRVIASWVRFRYRLLPYLYTLAYEAGATGIPPVRPAAWGCLEDGSYRDMAEEDLTVLLRSADTFLLGDSLFAAPVVHPAHRSRLCVLPPGEWSCIWDRVPSGQRRREVAAEPAANGRGDSRGSRFCGTGGGCGTGSGYGTSIGYVGGRTARLPGPLPASPLLAKMGRIVPLDDGFAGVVFKDTGLWLEGDGELALRNGGGAGQAGAGSAGGGAAGGGAQQSARRAGSGTRADTGASPAAPFPGEGKVLLDSGHRPRLLSFHIWPDSVGGAEGSCYDDAGDGYGSSRIDRLTWRPGERDGTAQLLWEREGSYGDPPLVRVVVHGMSAEGASVGGESVEWKGQSCVCAPFEELHLEGLTRS